MNWLHVIDNLKISYITSPPSIVDDLLSELQSVLPPRPEPPSVSPTPPTSTRESTVVQNGTVIIDEPRYGELFYVCIYLVFLCDISLSSNYQAYSSKSSYRGSKITWTVYCSQKFATCVFISILE